MTSARTRRAVTAVLRRHDVLIIAIVLLLFVGASGVTAQGGAAGGSRQVVPVDVGVILDMKTWSGNTSWACMEMAMEDFYANASHAGYRTRLKLHLRDTRLDAVDAASAGVDLLKNVRAQAIVGPQTSTQAKFLSGLGIKSLVPFISFSAYCSSRPGQNPYFIRTGWNDSSQAEAIASLVQSYHWREVVPVFEDDDSNTKFIPDLVDALRQVGTRVSYRCKIRPLATEDDLKRAILTLKCNWTSVFVVRMSHTLARKFFNLAKEEGIISQGFVWITAHGSTDILDVVSSRALDAMQGVLQVKPHVQDTVELQNFRQRWRNKYRSKNPGTRLSEPILSGLYAYDTIWALALAAEKAEYNNSESVRSISNSGSTDFEKIGASKTAKKLRGTLLDVNFMGLSGKFRIQDLQLLSVNYEIINIVGQERRLVGFWTPGSGFRTADLPTIIWPGDNGNNGTAPRGWLFPMNKVLKIGVPMKGGFDKFVTYENGLKPKGFCIYVFEAVVRALPYHVAYSYHVFEDGKGKSNGNYDELVQKVYLKEYDAVVGDITILANRSSYVDFTLPYTDSGVRMLVPVRDRRQKTPWTFLKPLTAGLWLGTGAFVVFTGFVVWCIEHRVNEGFRGPPVNQIGSVFYFSFSTLVFAHREKIVNNLSRVIVVVWLFVVLILQQSYTASLSSILTVEQLQPTVTNLEDVIRQGSYVGYLNDSFMPGLLKSLKIDESKMIAFNSPTEYNEALTTGRVAVIIDEIPYLKVFLEQYCHNYTMIGPTYKFDGFGFAFPRGSPLTSAISREILRFASTAKMSELEKGLYGDKSCPDKDDSQTSSSLTLHSFQGLFTITGASSMLALILHIVITFYKDWHGLNSDSSQNSWNRCLNILSKLFQERSCPSNNQVKEPTTKNVGTTTIEIPLNLDTDIVYPQEDEGMPAEELPVQDAEPRSFAHSESSQSSWNKCRNILSKLFQERSNPSNNPDKEPTMKNVGTATIEIPLNLVMDAVCPPEEGTAGGEHSVQVLQDAEPPSVAHSERGLNVAAFLSRNGSSIRRRQVNA